MYKKITATLLLSLLCTTASFAGGSNYPADEIDKGINLAQPQDTLHFFNAYARDGKSYYVYGGYSYAHLFISSDQLTLSNGSAVPPTIGYPAKTIMPDQQHNFEIGFGKELGRNFDIQLAYIQQLESKKSSIVFIPTSGNQPAVTHLNSRGVTMDVAYIINPDDRIQIAPEVGASVISFEEKLSTTGTVTATYTATQTVVSPSIGAEAIFEVAPKFSLRTSVKYAFGFDSHITNGQINTFIGMSYTI